LFFAAARDRNGVAPIPVEKQKKRKYTIDSDSGPTEAEFNRLATVANEALQLLCISQHQPNRQRTHAIIRETVPYGFFSGGGGGGGSSSDASGGSGNIQMQVFTQNCDNDESFVQELQAATGFDSNIFGARFFWLKICQKIVLLIQSRAALLLHRSAEIAGSKCFLLHCERVLCICACCKRPNC
jgi:hypothetical protein